MALKEFKTFEEQIDILTSKHNLQVNNKDNALMILKSMNYYTIKGYGFIFEDKLASSEHYTYKDGTTIEDIYEIYKFDSQLKTIILSAIGYIEKRMRTEISNMFILNHGGVPDCYLNYDIYFPKEKLFAQKFFNRIYGTVITTDEYGNLVPKDKTNKIVKLHIDKYDGKFPLWVLIEYFSIGDILSFFGCMNRFDQSSIASIYKANVYDFDNQVYVLKFLRNICAHFNRLFGKNVPKVNKFNSNSLFDSLLIVKEMILDKEISDKFANDLINLFNRLFTRYPNLNIIGIINFPSDWEEKLSN